LSHLWAVADQAFFSLGNLLLHLLLARWLLEGEYGAFASSYAVLVLAGTVHTALLTEPLLIFGNARFQGKLAAYVRVVRRFHFLLTLLMAVVLVAVYLALRAVGEATLSEGALGVSIAVVFSLLFYLYRKACYLLARFGLAAAASVVYLIALTSGLYLFLVLDRLNLVTGYILLGAASLIASVFVHVLLGFRAEAWASDADIRHEVLAAHIRYGRWALGTGLLLWIPSQMYYFVLPMAGDLEGNAAFRAIMNVVMPLVQTNLALANVMLPHLVRIRDGPQAGPYVIKFRIIVLGLCFVYWMGVASFAHPLIDLVYGGRYVTHASLLWLAGAIPLVAWLAMTERTVLQALERPDLIFWGNALGSGVALTVGVYLTFRYDLRGALIGMLCSYGAMWIVLRLQQRWVRRDTGVKAK
jgi:O-antigen/teichoic acid export membrane protein